MNISAHTFVELLRCQVYEVSYFKGPERAPAVCLQPNLMLREAELDESSARFKPDMKPLSGAGGAGPGGTDTAAGTVVLLPLCFLPKAAAASSAKPPVPSRNLHFA